jgi:hypothetical protein
MSSVSLLARAEQVAHLVTDRLTDDGRRERLMRSLAAATSKPAVNVWRPSGLSLGGAGLAVMCAAFGEVFPGQEWEVTGHRQLTDVVTEIGSSHLDASLFTGMVGAAAAVSLSSADGTRYQGLSGHLDALMLPAMRRLAEDAPPGPHTYDVVHGMAGWAGYLRTRPRSPEVEGAARAVAHALARVLGDGEPHRMSRRRTRPGQAAETVVDCGLAHGAGGVLAALSLLETHFGFGDGEIACAIRRGGHWLAAQARTVDGQILWPDAVARGPAPTDERPLHAGSWCHGSSGVARAVYLAGVAADEAGLRDLAVDAMRGHCRRYPELASPSVCHGLAGQVLLALAFAYDTREPVFVTAAGRLAERLHHRYRDGFPLGFREVEGDGGTEVDHPGLLRGAQGIALTLLAAHLGRPPRWGRLLLLW